MACRWYGSVGWRHAAAIRVLLVFFTLADPLPAARVGQGLDMAISVPEWPSRLSTLLDELGARPEWIRLRDIPEPGTVPAAVVEEARATLADVRGKGIRIVLSLRWEGRNWDGKSGGQLARGGRKPHLPVDLRAVHRLCLALGEAYGDLVDVWEVDNEPDLLFVPETAERYAAFLKAAYWGFKAGGGRNGRVQSSAPVSGHGWGPEPTIQVPRASFPRETNLVAMAPIGLPGGPWLEHFVRNDGLAYSDLVNFHYYGYVEGLAGNLSCIEDVLRRNLAQSGIPTSSRLLPIISTEIGYGLLGKREMDTKSGRLRQFSWFSEMAESLGEMGLLGSMAFVLRPHLEESGLEFGLLARKGVLVSDVLYRENSWIIGRERVTVADLDARRVWSEPWVREIGRLVDGRRVTPALAKWLGTKPPERVCLWRLPLAKRSGLVLDFFLEDGGFPIKRYGGYCLTKRDGDEFQAAASIVVYNFGDAEIIGAIEPADPRAMRIQAGWVRVPAGGRVTVPVLVRVQDLPGRTVTQLANFRCKTSGDLLSTISVRLFTDPAGSLFEPVTIISRADAIERSGQSGGWATRAWAKEEATREPSASGWLVQEGATVNWISEDEFEVIISSRPPGKERRIEVELPLKYPGPVAAAGMSLRLWYRVIGQRAVERGRTYDEFLIQIRTEDGNLYGVYPMLEGRDEWKLYAEPLSNFNLWFYGNLTPPAAIWSKRIQSLNLVFYPKNLPVIFRFKAGMVARSIPNQSDSSVSIVSPHKSQKKNLDIEPK